MIWRKTKIQSFFSIFNLGPDFCSHCVKIILAKKKNVFVDEVILTDMFTIQKNGFEFVFSKHFYEGILTLVSNLIYFISI